VLTAVDRKKNVVAHWSVAQAILPARADKIVCATLKPH
jgi:hypothetical protein